jgi:hypothetical protein
MKLSKNDIKVIQRTVYVTPDGLEFSKRSHAEKHINDRPFVKNWKLASGLLDLEENKKIQVMFYTNNGEFRIGYFWNVGRWAVEAKCYSCFSKNNPESERVFNIFDVLAYYELPPKTKQNS